MSQEECCFNKGPWKSRQEMTAWTKGLVEKSVF